MSDLSHIDGEGRARMVDVSGKDVTVRMARATGAIRMQRETLDAIQANTIAKGDVLGVARLAGVMAAKRTADLIPLCHPLPLTHVDVRAEVLDDSIYLEAEVATRAQTGVEMEALTAVSVAALTIYDMCKAIDKSMTITDVRLELKTGGKSGDYRREINPQGTS